MLRNLRLRYLAQLYLFVHKGGGMPLNQPCWWNAHVSCITKIRDLLKAKKSDDFSSRKYLSLSPRLAKALCLLQTLGTQNFIMYGWTVERQSSFELLKYGNDVHSDNYIGESFVLMSYQHPFYHHFFIRSENRRRTETEGFFEQSKARHTTYEPSALSTMTYDRFPWPLLDR